MGQTGFGHRPFSMNPRVRYRRVCHAGLMILLFSFTPAAVIPVRGVDCSILNRIEDNGGVYTENGFPQEALAIFRDHGVNIVRLKLWVNPVEPYNGLPNLLTMASRIKAEDLGFFLDFHYSDTWADPGNQTKPQSWVSLDFNDLVAVVYTYTFDVITALKNQGTSPEIVQIGNEINCGMLWNDGRVCGPWNTDEQWDHFGDLVNEGIAAVRDALYPDDSTRICIHFSNGGDAGAAEWFFDQLSSRVTDFDIIGLSYYPWWHGSFENLVNNLTQLETTFGKDLLITETAYPWTLNWADNVQNIIGQDSQLSDGFPASVSGQRDFLDQLISVISAVPEGHGLGLIYWSPEWITTETYGSPWENLTLFDFQGELLDSMDAFRNCELSGDLNQDAILDVLDLVMTMDCILNINSCNCGDLNDDGAVDIEDVVLMVAAILGDR